ncbi:REn protein [Spilanthes yellow vein virus]|uniref:Replication enhancer n=1 Tax=Spilanthes yellow vein virus TaxID=390439 RepID=A5H166_9GEMI|nr:REn protein [Spilanthes yellow vein virus]ABG26027.1 REn protein [Spilanthes yellow vein virus]
MDSRTGELITAAQAENGVYIWTITNPLYFKIINHENRPFLMETDIITIRIQFNYNLRKALGIHKCFLTYRVWTSLQPQTSRFLRVFKTQLMMYLNNLGVISVNNVIRAVKYVLYERLNGTVDIEETNDIKYNIY